MSKNILTVQCNKKIKYDEWDSVCQYIKQQVGDEYHVIGLLKGMEIKCITDEDKIFIIDGDAFSYKAIKEAITAYNKQDVVPEEKTDAEKEDTK